MLPLAVLLASCATTGSAMDLDALWDYDDPAASEARFRSHLDEGAKGEARLEALTQIARAQGLQRRFEEAHATLDEVEAELERASPRVRVRYLLERGRVLNSSKEQDEARALFIAARALAVPRADEEFTIDAVHMLAIVETDPEARLELNLEALALAESATTARGRKWLGSLYNNIGWTWHDQGEHEKALDLFEKALSLREAEGKPEATRIARWCVARALRSLGRIDEALGHQEALLAEWERAGGEDGYVFEELGELYLLRGEAERAQEHFARAWALLSKDAWLLENEPERMARLERLASGRN